MIDREALEKAKAWMDQDIKGGGSELSRVNDSLQLARFAIRQLIEALSPLVES